MELVPPDFHLEAQFFYNELGQPEVNRENIWNIYLALHQRFEAGPEMPFDSWLQLENDLEEEDEVADAFNFSENLQPLQGGVIDTEGYYYLGGLNNGAGLPPTADDDEAIPDVIEELGEPYEEENEADLRVDFSSDEDEPSDRDIDW